MSVCGGEARIFVQDEPSDVAGEGEAWEEVPLTRFKRHAGETVWSDQA